MKVTVNPDAQASGEFSYAAPGEYSLRVAGCEVKRKVGGEFPYIEWKFEFADPNVAGVEKNNAGQPLKVGNIFEITSLAPNAQFRLRDCCEALGLTWGDFDTAEVRGKETRAKVGIETYNGKIKNVIDRFTKR